MTTTGGAPYAVPVPPPRAPRDTTRTIAVVALVLAVVAVLGQLLTALLPMLVFGAFGLFGAGFDEGSAVFGPMDPGSGMGESYGVTMPGESGQPLSGTAVSAALAAVEPFTGRSMRCEGVAEVQPGAMSACRTVDGSPTYVVVELDGEGQADLRWFSSDAMMDMGFEGYAP
jgi:hypothetical protein